MRSKTRTTISAGRFKAYAKKTRLSVFDFSPPSMSAGCGGVSLHFGGLSFANGEQYKQLVESIIQNSPGLLIQLAITTACEPCGTAFKNIQKVVDLARKASTDSCEAASMLIGTAANMFGLCSAKTGLASLVGGESDQAAASERCQSKTDQYDIVKMAKETDDNGNQKSSAEKDYCEEGERSWCALATIDLLPSATVTDPNGMDVFAPKKFAEMNNNEIYRRAFAELLYHQMPKKQGATDAAAKAPDPKSSGDELMGGRIISLAFMCGRSAGSVPSGFTPEQVTIREEMLQESCSAFWDLADTTSISVLDSDSEAAGGLDRLKTPTFAPMKVKDWMQSRKFASVGLLPRVLDTVLKAFNSALTRTSLGAAELSLIQNTPLPLIQLLNLSQSYPLKALHILSESSDVITKMILQTTITDAVKMHTSDLSMSRIKQEDQEVVKKAIADFLLGAQVTFEKDEIKNTEDRIVEFVMSSQNMLTQEISRSTLGNNLQFHQSFLYDTASNPKNDTN
ncbi:conjugal transfer protein TraH [Pseudoalteromonas marina]|uniref:Conjugal transfer protein TraH n=1 Tax=Pseudoalteromonas marina TaxID=267375 RepID=A0ABT9FC71_9GAMM|nr:conjugal transfer protein TraH [Pseudoalteromonas marina]MDP2564383.1 conjugal transfer protein TraH [Pseudoalteromonas marina]